jgi:potassium channel subfamily K
MFPFALITISGLAVMISTIVKHSKSSPETRKSRWKAIYEQRQEKESQDGKPADELIAEIKFLEKANRQEKSLSNLYDLLLSMAAFVIFWGIGGLLFTTMEPWTYGESMYFTYVFFLVSRGATKRIPNLIAVSRADNRAGRLL